MTTTTANGTKHSDPRDQVLSYDDVEKYTYCHYQGIPGWVIDKGSHLSSARGNHLLVELDEPISETTNRKEVLLHERVVSRYLRLKKKLWIDWTEMRRKRAKSD